MSIKNAVSTSLCTTFYAKLDAKCNMCKMQKEIKVTFTRFVCTCYDKISSYLFFPCISKALNFNAHLKNMSHFSIHDQLEISNQTSYFGHKIKTFLYFITYIDYFSPQFMMLIQWNSLMTFIRTKIILTVLHFHIIRISCQRTSNIIVTFKIWFWIETKSACISFTIFFF